MFRQSCGIVACAAFAFLAGCGAREAARTPVEPPESLSIFYTCDTRGHIEACNCTAGVAGGMPRRKTFLAENRSANSVLVDAGDVTAGTREWELLELEYILRAYRECGYHAVNIGRREAGIPVEALRELAGRYPFFVSANVVDADGEPVVKPYQIAELARGYRVGILGVVENTFPADEVGAGLRVIPPEEAIAKVLPEVKAKSDFVLLLAFCDEAAMKSLAERFFEIDAIVGGDVAQPSGTPLEVNRSVITYVTDKGKSVGRLDLMFVDTEKVVTNNEITMLMEDVADDPAIMQLVAELKQKQVENNYPTEKDDEEGLSSVAAGG